MSSIGEEPKGLQFYLENKNLSYDGKFLWDGNKETCIELTRALEKEKGGKNEHLKEKYLELNGAGPSNFDFVGAGNKCPRDLLNNFDIPPVSGSSEDPQKTIARLKDAFDKKNQGKYKGMWLIITLPNPFSHHYFNEICDLFWKEVDKEKWVFNRVFVISEEFVNCGDIDIVTLSIGMGETYTKRRKPQTAIWDSGLIYLTP